MNIKWRIKLLNVVPFETHIMCFGSNVVPWKAQTGEFYLKCNAMWSQGTVCLDSKYSAMVAPDWYVKTQNVVPWEPHIGVFMLTM